LHRLCRPAVPAGRQPEREDRAGAGFAARLGRPAVRRRQVADAGQAEAAAAGLQPPEPVEAVRQFAGRDTASGIGDVQHHLVAGPGAPPE